MIANKKTRIVLHNRLMEVIWCLGCQTGKVMRFDSLTGKHHVVYDIGDERDYDMLEETWELVK